MLQDNPGADYCFKADGPCAVIHLFEVSADHRRKGVAGEADHIPNLRAFIRTVVQADIYGISMSKVLRTEAGEMRLKRRRRAEEQAMKIPVKVLIPPMLCILPVLFIVLLGPAVLNVMETLG